MLAGLAFCEIVSQYPQSAFRGLSGVTTKGQQQFATQTLRVHLLGRDLLSSIRVPFRHPLRGPLRGP